MEQKDEIRELVLLQTNNMTFGQFSVSEWQDNILTCINQALQKHMTADTPVSTDLFGEPYVTIRADEVGGSRNKAKVIKEAKGLMNKTFTFRWCHPNTHRTIETCGVIVTTIHDEVGTNLLRINFNKWAIPFLIYYGKGVGGTWFNKNIALQLRGDKTKRIYKILCSQADKTEYYYPIKQFRKDFEISSSYTNTMIKRKILEPAKIRIKESNSEVWFDYEMITRFPKNNGRKPMADTIVFHIKNINSTGGTPQSERNNFIYDWINRALDYPTDNSAVVAFNKVLEGSRTEDFCNRIDYWVRCIESGEMTTPHVLNSIRKVLRDDYHIK